MQGKWSIVEFYFVVFVITGFQIIAGSPPVAFLPDTDIFEVEIILILQRGLYIFVAAVLLSIFLSNLLVIYDAKVKESHMDLRESAKFTAAHSTFRNSNATGENDQFIKTSALGRIMFSAAVAVTVGFTALLFQAVLVTTTIIGLAGVRKGNW